MHYWAPLVIRNVVQLPKKQKDQLLGQKPKTNDVRTGNSGPAEVKQSSKAPTDSASTPVTPVTPVTTGHSRQRIQSTKSGQNSNTQLVYTLNNLINCLQNQYLKQKKTQYIIVNGSQAQIIPTK